ncbi:MAG TPA: hypothetical protein PKI32_06985 [Opitutales bacterium]|nr:hypothetical protein [Opitutales bacterium]
MARPEPVPWARQPETPKSRLKIFCVATILLILTAGLTLVIGGLVAATIAHFVRE